ncbi:MAG: hypothetical protein ACKO1N_00035 [Erythrobacter sp.]
MNGPAIQPRAPFFASKMLVFLDRIAAFAFAGARLDEISKRNPKG